MRTAIYTRISKDKTGEEAGVERQLVNCQELVEKLGWNVVETYTDNDISAFSGKTRHGFEALLADIGKGKIDALVCWHPDRLYRTLRDLVRLLDVGEGLAIRTVRGGDIDLSTSAGRMMATILGSVANQESEHHAERRRDANRQRALAGSWYSTGMRCYGYDRKGVPLEPEASLLRSAAKDILAGRSLSSIAKQMNEAGHRTVNGTKWSNLKLRRALMSPRIAGQSVHQGKVVAPGKWEPIIDEVTWRGLCAYLTDPSRRVTVSFDRKHLGGGVYKCGHRSPDADHDDPDSICGRKLYSSYPHGPNRSMTYTCRPVVHLGRKGADLDRFVETITFNYLKDNAIGTGLHQAENDIDVADLLTQREALQATKDQLATLLRKGFLDMAGVERESAILTQEIADINAQLSQSAQTSPLTLLLEDGEEIEDLDEALLALRWKNASPDIKGKLVSMLMDVIVHPAPRGTRTFDPDLIEIRWK